MKRQWSILYLQQFCCLFGRGIIVSPQFQVVLILLAVQPFVDSLREEKKKYLMYFKENICYLITASNSNPQYFFVLNVTTISQISHPELGDQQEQS